MKLPFLPPELKLLVARNLSEIDEDASLQCLSFVSREWRFPAQAFLLRRIFIPIIRMHSVQDELFHSNSSLAPHINEVHIYGRRSVKIRFRIDVADLVELTTLLPNLRYLALYGCLQVTAGAQAAAQQRRRFNLALTSAIIDGTSLITLLHQFCGGSELLLNYFALGTADNGLDSNTAVADLHPKHFQSVKRLYLGIPWGFRLHNELIRHLPSTLTSLGIILDPIFSKSDPRLEKLLKVQATHVVDLQIDITDQNIFPQTLEEYIGEHISVTDHGFGVLPSSWRACSLLHCCPSLRALTIAITVVNEKSTEHPLSSTILHWRYALQWVASAPQTLRTVRIGLNFNTESVYLSEVSFKSSTMDFVDWGTWDTVLSGFKQLEEVVFFRMDPPGGKWHCYEPMQSRKRIPNWFREEMREVVGNRLSEARWKLVRFICY
ncbi:hypothetical protein BXZ70DRAFT_1011343 [Cristinia sonorae]|uniref:F-box domain-containing protein n=1 Tax=Cristinia sonorae TaxID=1940300 RepID=A0A8K0XLE4_9AGAR|nr:hypothetical protein BXZ70DRAFT_1011343 [Cristinia sonorae]